MSLTFSIPTLLGVEKFTGDELRAMQMKNITVQNGLVLCEGTKRDIPRLNLRLRTGERVQLLLGRFKATTFDELFEGVKALPWESVIPKDGAFPVKGFSLNSTLKSIPSCQSIVKKAIVDRLASVYKEVRLAETGSVYQVQFSIMKDTVSLMIDTSGTALHKRGYREVGVKAPIRETLAASMVMLSGYRGRDPFCDPFCGSGTIAIEAALIAKNRAPGLSRSFAAQKWSYVPTDAWLDAADEAMDLEFDRAYDIWGGDIDPKAIAIAKSNAEKADVEDIVRFEVADACKFHREEPYGYIVTNPPYGERLLEKKEAEELYRSFGQATAKLPSGWRVSVLSSHTEFEKSYGRGADKKRKLYNGMIKCDVFQYKGKK